MSQVAAPARAALVALVGNPNAGKTTVFNALTGAHQKVGNYPGVTVERVSGSFRVGERQYDCVDVPGLYSMDPVSEDERVAAEVIRGLSDGERKPDVLVVVLDASNLERNLFVFSQIADLRVPLVVALTMTDLIERQGGSADAAVLSGLLGCEVVTVVGHRGVGIEELKRAVDRALETPTQPAELPDRPVHRCSRCSSVAPCSNDLAARYGWAAGVARTVVRTPVGAKGRTLTDKLDAVVLHRVYGMALFFALMYVVFQSIYTFAAPMMDGIAWVFERFAGVAESNLVGAPILQSLVVEGLIGGVGTVVTFLPQILILFFFVSVLEGTGYMSRAAFLMDRVLSICGLNGRAFIPLLSSFACAVPGIMAARVMPDPKARLTTILVSPLMSCSARLPIYLLIIGAFVEPLYGPVWAGVALFGMHLVGLAVAIPMVWVINKGVVKGKRMPFVLELPPYQTPKWRDVWLAMFIRAKVFLKTAGSIIVILSLAVWALLYFPRDPDAAAVYRAEHAQRVAVGKAGPSVETYVRARQLEGSYMGRMGKAIEPAFAPAGFDWRLCTSVLAAFPAREVAVSSMGIMFNASGSGGDQDLRKALQDATWPDGRKLMTPWTAVALMVFFALCCQCMATLAAIRRETNSLKWPAFVFAYMTALAYMGAVAVQQVGRLFD